MHACQNEVIRSVVAGVFFFFHGKRTCVVKRRARARGAPGWVRLHRILTEEHLHRLWRDHNDDVCLRYSSLAWALSGLIRVLTVVE